MVASCASSGKRSRAGRSLDEFAHRAVAVARAAEVDTVLCVTESGLLCRRLMQFGDELPIVAATPSRETHQELAELGIEVLHLPVRVSSRFREARHAIAVALQAGAISPGDLVQCVIGQGLPVGQGDFIVLLDVQQDASHVPLHHLISIANDLQAGVVDAALQLACRVGHAAHRGKRVGAIFMLGDSDNVLVGSRQLVPNPFGSLEDADRSLTNAAVHDMLLELAKLDGAFVIRGDGLILTAGAYLAPGDAAADVAAGLGARHVTVAAVTARTSAIGIVVSATDGNVRIYSRGNMVMLIEPDAPDWRSMINEPVPEDLIPLERLQPT